MKGINYKRDVADITWHSSPVKKQSKEIMGIKKKKTPSKDSEGICLHHRCTLVNAVKYRRTQCSWKEVGATRDMQIAFKICPLT